jgi:hypothetical protein
VDTHTFPKEDENVKHTLFARNLMASVFWDRKGAPVLEFTEEETIITSEVYWETLKNKCVRPFRTKGVEF